MKFGKRRVITIRFASSREAAEFLQYAASLVSNLAAEQSGSALKLILLEPSEDDYRKLMELLRQWRLSRQAPRKGVYRHSVTLLLSSMDLKVGIPVSALADILALKGYRAALEGGYLVTNAPFDTVVKLGELFSSRYADAVLIPAPPMVRRLIAVLATVREVTVDEALEELERMGLVKLDEGSGRYVLTRNYEQALDELRRAAAGAQ